MSKYFNTAFRGEQKDVSNSKHQLLSKYISPFTQCFLHYKCIYMGHYHFENSTFIFYFTYSHVHTRLPFLYKLQLKISLQLYFTNFIMLKKTFGEVFPKPLQVRWHFHQVDSFTCSAVMHLIKVCECSGFDIKQRHIKNGLLKMTHKIGTSNLPCLAQSDKKGELVSLLMTSWIASGMRWCD